MEHVHEHDHPHTHEGGEHTHSHSHPHTHEHVHAGEGGEKAAALLSYMLEHNVHHCAELKDLAAGLSGEAQHQLLHAVEAFEEANGHLARAVEELKKQEHEKEWATMCLSTVYRNSKAEENVCAKYVAKIDVDGNKLTFTDVLGEVIQVEGKLVSADLTAGVVVFAAAWGPAMPTYEMCCEIFNQCSNNQMRDISFEEVSVEDTDAYIRQLEPRASIEREELSDGSRIYHTDTAGLQKRYSFTPL